MGKGRRHQKDLDYLNTEVLKFIKHGLEKKDAVKALRAQYTPPTIRKHYDIMKDEFNRQETMRIKIDEINKLVN